MKENRALMLLPPKNTEPRYRYTVTCTRLRAQWPDLNNLDRSENRGENTSLPTPADSLYPPVTQSCGLYWLFLLSLSSSLHSFLVWAPGDRHSPAPYLLSPSALYLISFSSFLQHCWRSACSKHLKCKKKEKKEKQIHPPTSLSLSRSNGWPCYSGVRVSLPLGQITPPPPHCLHPAWC